MRNKVEEALDKLKTTGVRMTPQRHAILSFLMDVHIHPTVDEIYKSLESRFPHMSVATVYNNLKLFLEAGLVRELAYGDGASRFDADMHDHYHAICDQCGTMSYVRSKRRALLFVAIVWKYTGLVRNAQA
jgi:Fur family transcriptional regulator, peroxide stress response regulator